LEALRGVGARVAEKLAARGLLTVQDLWLHLPVGYEDRTRITPVAELRAGVPAQVEGRVLAVERGFRYRPMLKVALADESRHAGAAVFPFPRIAGGAIGGRHAGPLLRHAAARPIRVGDRPSELSSGR
jgi:ATP-dependent DNA helicase RecG